MDGTTHGIISHNLELGTMFYAVIAYTKQTVLQQYSLCGDTSVIKITTQTVLEDALYINSHIIAFFSEIGDTALIQVSSAVLFGPNPLGNSITTPPPAIEEWANGIFQLVQLAQPPGSIHFEELRTAAEKYIIIY
ncbi:hypothetical protein C8R48DRAFT_672202 [Suillus tomentosus]|nr:hypothetical protein C8R48DRAFT_672202 [Suillus tomentosus]